MGPLTTASPEQQVDGVVVVDKPAGWTSHDVVARCRRIYGQRRVGHSGTLDPGATGVLLVGLGRATRLLRFLTDLPKRYTGEVVLGVGTSTLDDDGEVVQTADPGAVTAEQIAVAAAVLTGPILQVPPMVSAVRVEGKRLHRLAREGIEVERAPWPVTVHRFAVEPSDDPTVWRIDVTCSSGTYVRVLAADLGAGVGVPAHLRGLRRVAIGSFGHERARTLAEVEADPAGAVLAPADALVDYQAIEVDDEVARLVAHGRALAIDRLPLAGPGPGPTGAGPGVAGAGPGVAGAGPGVAGAGPGVAGAGPGLTGPGPWRVLDRAGTLLAVYERGQPGVLAAAVVLTG